MESILLEVQDEVIWRIQAGGLEWWSVGIIGEGDWRKQKIS